MPGLALLNFRGFDYTIIPFAKTNFLVGENSTGKSSALAVIEILSNPAFYFSQELASEYNDFSLYEDIVSQKNPRGKVAIGYFRLSYSITKKGVIDCIAFHFNNDEGRSNIKSIYYLSNGYLIKSEFRRSLLTYTIFEANIEEGERPISAIDALFRDRTNSLEGQKVKEGEIKYSELPLPSPLITALNILALTSTRKSDDDPVLRTRIGFGLFSNPLWIAPLRAEPTAINTKTKVAYSPKGDHIPTLIRRAYGNNASPQLAKRLSASLPQLGEKSHLYDSIGVHEYGENPSSPFEVTVDVAGTKHRLANVGYGVSQSLPIAMELAAAPENQTFLIQQPEVHLHPRAQAAFGDFFHQMMTEQNHTLFIETHSDFIIDRFRISTNRLTKRKHYTSQVIFFSKNSRGFNAATSIPIRRDGSYPSDLPEDYRDFFFKEQLELLRMG